jgi:hypothetical protein
MKKLLILTTFVIVTAVLGGCRLCDRLWRGSAVTAQPGAVCCDPCGAVPACDPCGSAGPVMVSPSAGVFPGPVQ